MGFLTKKQAAERLGLSESTINAWVSMRKLRYVKMGRRVYFREADIAQFIESCIVNPGKKLDSTTDRFR